MASKERILVCDDEELVRWSLVAHLKGEGYDVIEASNGRECLEKAEANAPALILLDLRMPEMGGLECLQELRQRGHETAVVVLTALGNVEPAIEATRLGAARYLTKPFELSDISKTVAKVLDERRVRTAVDAGEETERAYGDLIGASAAMVEVFETLARLEDIDAPTVLITGESGTGKDLVARAIHDNGPRSSGPLIEVDCTAIPETLMESTLFGHEKGAFTDAKNQRRGLFEAARGGVVFLDEIGELPAGMQAKLLRSLENRRFKRVGGNTDIRLDAAIIAATNRDLAGEVRKGRFREDLYYRLAVVPIKLPPLRGRGDDVVALIHHFISVFNTAFGRSVEEVTADAMTALTQYRWPGNVRELRNVIERLVIFNETGVIEAEDLPPAVRYARPAVEEDRLLVLPEDGLSLEELERDLVRQAVDRTDGNQSAAARLLGISRYALRNRMKKYGLL